MRFVAAVLVAVMSLTAPAPLAAQEASIYTPWMGTWALNVEKSTYNPGPAPYRRGTLTIQPWKDGVRTIYDLVRVRGGITHMEWDGRFDGTDYSVQGLEEFITYAYVPIDDRTVEVITKVDLTTVARSRVTLSPDGRTITTVTAGRNAQGSDVTTTVIYEKADS